MDHKRHLQFAAQGLLILDAGLGTSGRTLRPYNITLADNLFVVPEGGTLSRGTESETYNWVGNMVTLSSALPQHHGIKVVEPELRRDDDGVWRPSLLSPVRNSAQGVFPAVKTDIDGQKRSGGFDVGCDEFSHDPVVNRPLTAGDVGPHWLDRSSSTDQVLMSKRRSNP